MEQGPDRGLQYRQQNLHARHRHGHDPNAFFGLDVEAMSPRARVAVGLVMILPILLVTALFFTVLSDVWWIFMTYAWAVFPAFGLLIRGVSGFFDDEGRLPSGNSKERELLRALHEHGDLTPAQAAMETSLTVCEADEMLKGLAEGGHLQVRVRAGASSTLCRSSRALHLGQGRRYERGDAWCLRGMIPIPR